MAGVTQRQTDERQDDPEDERHACDTERDHRGEQRGLQECGVHRDRAVRVVLGKLGVGLAAGDRLGVVVDDVGLAERGYRAVDVVAGCTVGVVGDGDPLVFQGRGDNHPGDYPGDRHDDADHDGRECRNFPHDISWFLARSAALYHLKVAQRVRGTVAAALPISQDRAAGTGDSSRRPLTGHDAGEASLGTLPRARPHAPTERASVAPVDNLHLEENRLVVPGSRLLLAARVLASSQFTVPWPDGTPYGRNVG